MRAEAVIIKDVFPYLRRRFTFLRRTVYAAGASLIVFFAVAATHGEGPRELAEMGRGVFDAILWLMLVAGFFECTFAGATSVSSERERNTVVFWVLAGMEQVGMVMSKAAAVLTRTGATLLAPAVPAAAAIFLGGRSVPDAVASFIGVISILIFATAVSVAASAMSEKNSASVPAALIGVVALTAAPWAVLRMTGSSLAALHPFDVLGEVGRVKPPGFLYRGFLSLALSVAASVVILVFSGLQLRGAKTVVTRRFRPLAAIDRVLARLAPRFYHVFKPEPGNVDEQPVRWRERIALANMKGGLGAMTVCDKLFITLGGLIALTVALAVVAGAAGPYAGAASVNAGPIVTAFFIGFAILTFLYQIGFAVRASQGFSREFESRDMDLIRLTGLEGEEIVTGKMRAFARHYLPLLLMTAVLAWGILLLTIVQIPRAGEDFAGAVAMVLFRPLGWSAAGFGIAAVALLCSLYFRLGTRALYATAVMWVLIPVVASLVLAPFMCPVFMLPWPVRLAAQVVVAAFVLMALMVWTRNYDRSRFYSKQECLVLALFAVALLPRLGGALVGAVGTYLVAYTLMRREFDSFMKEEPAFARPGPMPALSYKARGVYALTHLGIPPSIETRLGKVLEKVTGRPSGPGGTAGAAPRMRGKGGNV